MPPLLRSRTWPSERLDELVWSEADESGEQRLDERCTDRQWLVTRLIVHSHPVGGLGDSVRQRASRELDVISEGEERRVAWVGRMQAHSAVRPLCF